MKVLATLAILLALTACGGGEATPDEIADADAALATTQPVSCANGACR